ncbi:MAG: hypothetical protein WC489_06340 [Patescibacteria group bacterium]|jgi:hypothetical protein
MTETLDAGTAGSQVTAPPTKIYIVKTKMSSPNHIEKSEEIGEYQRKTWYLFDKESRKKFSALRMKYKGPIYSSCLNFHGLYVCGTSSMSFIEENMAAATREFKAVGEEFMETELTKYEERARKEYTEKYKREPDEKALTMLVDIKRDEIKDVVASLHADVMFIPLDFQQIFKGSLYAQIGDAINYQVYSGLFTRMEKMLKRTEEGKDLPERSRKALIRMVDNLKNINVTGDEDIEKKLEEFKAQIERGEIKELAESLKNELDANKSRWEAIEL